MAPDAKRYLLYGSERYALPILRPLQAAIRRAGGEAAWFFDGPGAEHLEPGEWRLDRVLCARDWDPIAVFVAGNRVPDFIPGAKVQVFHGFSVGKRSDERGHFRIRGHFDLYCTQGSTTTPRFQALARRYGHFHVTETGWPKVDPLFGDDGGAALRWRQGWPADRPVVVYASTFTRSLSSAPAARDTIARLAATGRWGWILTLHPKTPAEVVAGYRELAGPDVRFAEPEEVVPALRAADVMVSDTSSVVFEFLLQHKPAVTICNTRPGPHLIDVRDASALPRAIETALDRRPDLMRAVARFAEEIHPYRDGASSERVLRATHEFLDRHRAGLKRRPWNFWRKLRVRRRLGYYRR